MTRRDLSNSGGDEVRNHGSPTYKSRLLMHFTLGIILYMHL